MIALARTEGHIDTRPPWHAGFLAMLPAIRSYARTAFRDLDDEAKEDAVVEVVANALVAYVALYKQGRESLAYRTVLTRYAVAQFRAGRRVGTPQNQQDVLAKRAQSRGGYVVQRLSEIVEDNDEWMEAVIEDPKTSVPEQAAFRCDFPEWLARHEPRTRHIAEALALGQSTRDVAARFGLSRGRISQMRSELHDSWRVFHGEDLV